VHRLGYHSAAAVASELDWVQALGDAGVVETPTVVPSEAGERVVEVAIPGLAEPRNVVLFAWLDGAEPRIDDIASFTRLGRVTAQMHAHARAWRYPATFTRFRWDYDHTLGPRGHWGRWQDGLGMGAEEVALLTRLDDTIRRELEAFGMGADRFGLAHADLRLANLLVDGDRTVVIDFDDCGLAWHLYDWATAVSFIEDDPAVPALRDAWLEGYRGVAPIGAEEEAMLDTFVALRRLLLTAWVGSHHGYATEAAALGAGFTAGTCALAEEYLSRPTTVPRRTSRR